MAKKRKAKGKKRGRKKRIVVMGLGNLLLSDEGLGVHVYRKLTAEGGLPGNVELFEAGTASLDALQTIGLVDKLVAVDAVKGGGDPGDIYRFKPEDIKSSKKISPCLLNHLRFMTKRTAVLLTDCHLFILIQTFRASWGLNPTLIMIR